MTKAFFYIFNGNGNLSNGIITGVPAVNNGTVFMGPCKPAIRSEVQKGDWIIGISNSKIKPRKILSMIEVESKPKLNDAIELFPEAIWSQENPRGQIWFNYNKNEDKYEYIPGSPHNLDLKSISKKYNNDIKKYPDTDTLIVGSKNSCLLEENGYVIDNKILFMIRRDPNKAVVKNNNKDSPFGYCSDRKCYGRGHVSIELAPDEIVFLLNITKNFMDKYPNHKILHRSKIFGHCKSC